VESQTVPSRGNLCASVHSPMPQPSTSAACPTRSLWLLCLPSCLLALPAQPLPCMLCLLALPIYPACPALPPCQPCPVSPAFPLCLEAQQPWPQCHFQRGTPGCIRHARGCPGCSSPPLAGQRWPGWVTCCWAGLCFGFVMLCLSLLGHRG